MQSVAAFLNHSLNLNASNQINVLDMDKQQFDNCLVVMDDSSLVHIDPHDPISVGLYRPSVQGYGGTHGAKL